jgi:hypothetical protein
MNKVFTKEALAGWIQTLKDIAADDEQISVSWFTPTKDYPVSIVGGWMNGFSPREADLFCQSKSHPTYAMCIKIVENNGPYVYCDFETLDMPVDDRDEVEDTCIALEWKDAPMRVAEFYMHEWERLMDSIV